MTAITIDDLKKFHKWMKDVRVEAGLVQNAQTPNAPMQSAIIIHGSRGSEEDVNNYMQIIVALLFFYVGENLNINVNDLNRFFEENEEMLNINLNSSLTH